MTSKKRGASVTQKSRLQYATLLCEQINLLCAANHLALRDLTCNIVLVLRMFSFSFFFFPVLFCTSYPFEITKLIRVSQQALSRILSCQFQFFQLPYSHNTFYNLFFFLCHRQFSQHFDSYKTRYKNNFKIYSCEIHSWFLCFFILILSFFCYLARIFYC